MPDRIRTVCVDSMLCVWGIKKKATEGQEHMIQKAESFFETLEKEGTVLLLPSPVLTELLCPVPIKERPELVNLINKSFRIIPIDAMVAIKAGELWHDLKERWADIYKKEGEDGVRNRFKFDVLILAAAIVRGVDYLYTEDKRLQKICEGLIDAGPIPELGYNPQLDMFGGSEKSGSQEVAVVARKPTKGKQ